MKPTQNAIGEVFYYTSSTPNDFLEICQCGITPPTDKYQIFRSHPSLYVLEYVISGKGWIDDGGELKCVRAGDFYFLRKGGFHHYYSDKEEPYEKIWINLHGRFVEGLCGLYGVNDSVLIRPCSDMRVYELIQSVHTVLSALETDPDAEILRSCSMKIAEIFSIVMRDETVAGGMQSIPTAERIRQYIDTQLYEDITLEDIAARFNLHEVYIIRIFRDRYGVTPVKYLNKRRIETACRMIEDGRMSLKEIAATLHFADAPYFTSRFKKEMGMPPSKYREQVILQK